MRFQSFLTRPLGALATVAAVALGSLTVHAAPLTDVVFSNDYDSSSTTTTQISGSNQFAVGFTTGNDPNKLLVTAIEFALSVSGTSTSASPTVQIFSGASNPTTLVGTLTGGPVTSATVDKIGFTGSVQLNALTNYWAVLSEQTGSQIAWYEALNADNPTAQNSSGYAYVGGRRSTNGGTSFAANNAAGQRYVAVQAVPEPSTLVLAGLGVAGAVALDIRRRSRARRAAAVAASEDDFLG